MNAVGNGVAGAGRGAGTSITNSSRNWGNSIREYGNSIKDVTGASGPRASTATNPLGMAKSQTSVKIQQQTKPGNSHRSTARDPLSLGR